MVSRAKGGYNTAPMIGLLQIIVFSLVLTFSSAGAHELNRDPTRLPHIRCVWALKKLRHLDEDAYRFGFTEIERDVHSVSRSPIDPLELKAALHLRRFISVPILLAPDIGKHKSTPGFDGVLYDHYGNAHSNLSIKSIDISKLTKGIIAQTMKSARGSARHQLYKVYDLEGFLAERGFGIDTDGSILPHKGLPHQIRAASRMQYYIDLFGLNRDEPRKTSILINVFNSDRSPGSMQPRFEIRPWYHRLFRGGRKEEYLFVQNTDGSHNEFGTNLSHLSENLRTDPRISEYIFLTPNQILVVRSTGVLLKELDD